jgi:hypothetical protein
VRSVLVVVAAVDAEHVLEVPAAEDEDPVEAVGANCADPAFGVGVRVRRLDRCADHPDPFGAENVVEGMAELRVAIVDEEVERLSLAKLHDEVASLLGHPEGFKMPVRRVRPVVALSLIGSAIYMVDARARVPDRAGLRN